MKGKIIFLILFQLNFHGIAQDYINYELNYEEKSNETIDKTSNNTIFGIIKEECEYNSCKYHNNLTTVCSCASDCYLFGTCCTDAGNDNETDASAWLRWSKVAWNLCYSFMYHEKCRCFRLITLFSGAWSTSTFTGCIVIHTLYSGKWKVFLAICASHIWPYLLIFSEN